MPTFFSREYMRPVERIGTTEKIVGAAILVLLGGTLCTLLAVVLTDDTPLFEAPEAAYSGVRAPVADSSRESGSSGTSEPFPPAGVEGWLIPERVPRYLPENLHVKIDGRAPLYIEHGVKGLRFGTYRHETDGQRLIDVYVYDFTSADGAAEMFRLETPPGSNRMEIGKSGYEIGGAVFFHVGRSYVQVMPVGVEEDDARASLVIARQIAAWVRN